jgi:hypothetical protein
MSYAKPIRAEDAHAVEQLQARIAEAERLQERMKTANKIVRDKKLTDDEKVARLGSECGIPQDGARKLLRPDFAGRIGFANYELTNNAANIRRMQARVDALTKEGARPSVTVQFPGGRMEDNAEDCRVRIYHDAKPGSDVIAKLKSNGFHWSPTLTCWQRLRNDSARWAAMRVTGVSWPEAGGVDSNGAHPLMSPSVATSKAASGAPRTGMAV